jgi:hypothetical protein
VDLVLQAFGEVDFQWTTHVDSVWVDPSTDIPALQRDARERVSARLARLQLDTRPPSPLGLPLLGTAGSGKTHLLSTIRREAFERGLYFALVDMTDVRDFWETVLLGYLRSLPHECAGVPQFARLLGNLSASLGDGMPTVKELSLARPPALINRCNVLIHGLARRHAAEMREHQDVLRALVLLCSDDFDIQDRGYQWLQGLGIGDDDAFRHGFIQTQKKPEHIVRGLSWLMSLDAPTVLAIDQLDALVAEHNLASTGTSDADMSDRQKASLAIIQGVAGGLSALRDMTKRTLTVLSSLEVTWTILDGRAPVSMKDRFEQVLLLQQIRDARAIQSLVESRLATAFSDLAVPTPYPSYPFKPEFFAERVGASPREVLKACNEHRHSCLSAGRVTEVGRGVTTPAPRATPSAEIQDQFDELVRSASVANLLEDQNEEALDKLLEAGVEALIEENPMSSRFDALIDKEFVGAGTFEPLHVRLRIVDRAQNDRERHYSFRFLEKTHHIAFQSRLKAAMTAAGIDRDIAFRRLAVVRTVPAPRGPLSESLVAELTARGGLMVNPSEQELKVLAAVRDLLAAHERSGALARDWLRAARPVSNHPLFRDAVGFLFTQEESAREPPPASLRRAPEASERPTTQAKARLKEPSEKTTRSEKPTSPKATTTLSLGERVVAGTPAGAFTLPLDNLTKHAVVLAGAGSGKTVLVRRLVEEAALLGVPSIVIDGANDLSQLGDRWPEPPASFTDTDRNQAVRYHDEAEVIVWSPGREKGNPLRLEPLPDFGAVADDADELNAALDMARSSLEPIAIGPRLDKVKQGVLGAALRFFAGQGGGGLQKLVALLSELPPEAYAGYEKGEKQGREAAERIRAETEMNPLLRGSGKPLDPAVLFHSRTPGKVRISVINLSGLPDQGVQQQFLNQLSMTLFSWIKKKPARGSSLQGLLVIDEARDFVPSGKSVPGKDNLIRLVAQARKYGLGIVFATQAPKSIDHNVIANCSTQFYGRQNSPAAIDTVREQLEQRGGSGSDIAKLPRGTFYAFTEGLAAPQKIVTPLCLSHHPASPPDESEVLARAQRSRAVV